jgi:hypothetical protein
MGVLDKIRKMNEQRRAEEPPQRPPQRPRQRRGEEIAVFYDKDLPSVILSGTRSDSGCSLYRGVLVEWDGDKDSRVLTLIDEMTKSEREALLAIRESKAFVTLLWDTEVPSSWSDDDLEVEGDIWQGESRVVPRQRLSEETV